MIQEKRLLNTFLRLVSIDSPSGNEQNVANYLHQRLEFFGGEVKQDSYGNIIAKFAGKGEPILLNAHMDTVQPGTSIKPQIHQNKIYSNRTTVLGGDPKAGIAIILECLESLNEDKKTHLPIEVVFTREEELGLLGASNLNYNLLSAKKGITFDGENSVTDIIISAPGYNQVDIVIIGKAAHAGIEPENGISAIEIASQIITKLPLGRIDEETTTNIGLIEGGSARNAVPERVELKGEIRSRSMSKLNTIAQRFKDIALETEKIYGGAQIHITIHSLFDPYEIDDSGGMITNITKVLRSMDFLPKTRHSGGGTDVNIFRKKGLDMVCVGMGGYHFHTTREFVVVQELVYAAKFCEIIVSNPT